MDMKIGYLYTSEFGILSKLVLPPGAIFRRNTKGGTFDQLHLSTFSVDISDIIR